MRKMMTALAMSCAAFAAAEDEWITIAPEITVAPESIAFTIANDAAYEVGFHITSLDYGPAALLHVAGLSLGEEHEILEDMRVMSAALSTMIAKAFPDDPNLQNVDIRSYILDSGCLFMARFPYHVPDEKAGAADKPEDEVWNSARQKLGYDKITPYDAAQFKETIRSALKLAKNIRHLEADNFIAIAAVGNFSTTFGTSATMLTARAPFGDLTNPEFTWNRASDRSAQGDAAVMSRVMKKLLVAKLQEQYSGGSPISPLFESFYLKGYGALFFVNVEYPVGKKGAGSAQPADLWQESLREMQSRSMRQADAAAIGRSLMNLTEKEAQELLSQTADAVLESLRYSPRIRGMGPDEALIVSIRGSDGSWLVFRSLKRHADAYGAGALDINAFREKVSVEMDMRPLSWETVMQSPAPPVDALTLTISEDGSMTLDGKAVTMAQLKLRFNSAPAEKKKQLIIRSGPKVGHEQIVEAMDLANRADIQKIGLAIEARQPNVTKGDGK